MHKYSQTVFSTYGSFIRIAHPMTAVPSSTAPFCRIIVMENDKKKSQVNEKDYYNCYLLN